MSAIDPVHGAVPAAQPCGGGAPAGGAIIPCILPWLPPLPCALLLILAIFIQLSAGAQPAIEQQGWYFFAHSTWDPVREEFGALSSIYGTLVSTALAMIIAVPLSLAIALFLVELAPPWLSTLVGGAPSSCWPPSRALSSACGVSFFWLPILADHFEPFVQRFLWWCPLFKGPPMGLGMITAGLVLALMILPFITSVTRDIFRTVPKEIRESAYGMGGTTWEVTRKVIVPYGLSGIMGASFLGLGRALGETMAVTFVIGNDHHINFSLFMPGNTASSTLANEFSEASDPHHLSALIELGLVLLIMSLIMQVIAQVWLRWMARKAGV